MTNLQTTANIENFYVAGGTLRGDAPSYVIRQADIQLFESLKHNDVCYVLTARQMGKSSLMVRTAARLRDEGVSVAVLDLTGLGQNLTAEQWYNGLLERLGQQLELEDELEEIWRRNEALGPLQRWVLAMRTVVLPSRHGRPLVVFVDEIDAVRSLAFSTDEFFAGIRELYNRRAHDTDLQRLTFCLMGVASPSDLIRDTRTTPFNIGRRIELTDFTAIEAVPLVQGLGREPTTGSVLLKRVLYWTGGHPYLTQRLCQAVAENRGTHDAAGVDRICRDLFLSHRARERDDNLLFVRERILRSEADTASLLSLYNDVHRGKKVRDEDTNPLVPILRLSGISRVDAGYLRVRNRVYKTVFDRDWILTNTPGAELRRQRAAYTRGAKVAAITLAPVILVVGYIVNLYRRDIVLPSRVDPPHPPAFWASFSAASAIDVNNGSLSVKTRDSNVTVFLDNQQYGHTNGRGELLIERLPAGLYIVRVEKPGFQSISQDANVEGRKITELAFKLQPQVQAVAAASVKIQGAPQGARVKLDGADIGLTSSAGKLEFTVSPGEHVISVAKDDFIPQEMRQRFTPGNTIVLDGTLKTDVESQRWQALTNNSDVANLEAFLKDYPNGRFSSKAREQAERMEWNSTKGGTDLRALTTYVNKYPQGQHVSEAQGYIKALQDEQDWNAVRNTKDAQKLQGYVDKHPQGLYQKAAEAEISKLKTPEPEVPKPTEAAKVAVSADSKSSVDAGPTTNDPDRQAINTLIQQMSLAFSHRSISELDAIWPKMGNKRSATKSAFESEQELRRQFHIQSTTIQPDHTMATVVGTYEGMVRQAGKDTPNSGNFYIHFSKKNGKWLVDDASF